MSLLARFCSMSGGSSPAKESFLASGGLAEVRVEVGFLRAISEGASFSRRVLLESSEPAFVCRFRAGGVTEGRF